MTEESTRQSVTTQEARNLATTTKTSPKMASITPRWFLNLLPWVQVGAGTFRVNQTKVLLKGKQRMNIEVVGDEATITPDELRSVLIFERAEQSLLEVVSQELVTETCKRGDTIITEGEDGDKLFIIAHGKLEMLAKGEQGEELSLKVLSIGENVGEAELIEDAPSPITVRALTDCVFLTLTEEQLVAILNASPHLKKSFQDALEERESLKASLNEYGEKPLGIEAGHEGEADLPETFVQYEAEPQEYPLSVIQSIVRVHSRVSDLYNDPDLNQLSEQLRLTIESMKERQEWEMINNKEFGLLHKASPSMRINSKTSAPTPDDLDEMLSLVWKKPAFFLAHPRAVAAFGRECTRRGVPPVVVNIQGSPFITWRGVPIIPCDKLAVSGSTKSSQGAGKTKILLMRVGEENQGVVGLHQTGIPGEIAPSLSARLMNMNTKAVASYLLTLYFSCAILTYDAVAVLEDVEVGYYYEYDRP